MKQKFTLLLCSFGMLFTLFGQATYKNGYLSTGTVSKSGTSAPTGFTWSEVQNDNGVTTISNTAAGSSGYFASAADAFSLADNFTVPAGQVWALNSIAVYGYQTGATTAPVNALYFRIWNGAPDVAGSTVVFGDLTTNRLSTTTDSLMYRIFNTLYPTGTAPGTTRKIWRFTGTGTVTLQPGTYWLEWQVHATNNSTVFFPSSTVVGTRGLAGWNAKQYNAATATWTNVLDAGNPDASPDIPQDFPFEVNYINTNPTPVKLLSFTGSQIKDGNELHWKTASETAFKGFDIERSVDGINFEKQFFVQSKGRQDNDYTLFDARVNSNTTYYYRLKQLDKNGNFEYSKVIALKTPELSDDVWIVSSTGRPVLTIRAEKDAVATIRLTNNSGQIISKNSLIIKKGVYSVELPGTISQPGVYYATIIYANEKMITKRFLIN